MKRFNNFLLAAALLLIAPVIHTAQAAMHHLHGGSPLHAAACHGTVIQIQNALNAHLPPVPVLPLPGMPLAALVAAHPVHIQHIQANRINNATANELWTPLHCAAWQGAADRLHALLHSPAGGFRPFVILDAQTNWHWTPLHLAARYNHHLAIIELLAAGANPAAQTNLGTTPRALATNNFAHQAVQTLDDWTNFLAAPNPAALPPMHLAAQTNNTTAIRILALQGIDLNQPDPNNHNRSPLHVAVMHNAIGVATTLLNVGANPNSVDAFGFTPLTYAAPFLAAMAPMNALLVANGGH